MSTVKQKRLASRIVENLSADDPETAGEMLENVGYAASVAKHKPGEIIKTEGVVEALKELGFDSNNAKRVVGEILNGGIAVEEKDRLKAAEMVFKVHGDFAAEKHINVNVEIAPTEELKQYSDALLTGQKAA